MGDEHPKPQILIVDDEPLILSAMRRSLGRDHDVTCATGGLAALGLVTSGHFDAIVCDLRMEGMSGQELHAEIVKAAPALANRMIFLAGELWSPNARSFLDAIPNARFDKPVDLAELRASIQAQMHPTPAA